MFLLNILYCNIILLLLVFNIYYINIIKSEDLPKLLSWDYDNRFGTFSLYFNVLMRANTLNVSKIKLQNSKNIINITKFNTFSFDIYTDDIETLTAVGNSTLIEFHMNQYSYSVLNENIYNIIGRKNISTFLTLETNSIYNSYLNASNDNYFNSTNALQVSNFIADSISPFVLAFSVDMDLEIVNITANEPINIYTFTSYGLSFQSNKNSYNGLGLYVPAVYSDYMSVFNIHNNHRSFSFKLNREDVNALKRTDNLYRTIDNCYMSAWQPFVDDTSGNHMTSVNFDVFVAMQASVFLPDISPPTLSYWIMNLNKGIIELHMSEVIFIQTFNFSSILLLTRSNLSNNNVRVVRVNEPINVLTQFDVSTINTDIIYVQLNSDQISQITDISDFQLGVNYSYLIMDYGAVKDTSIKENIFQGTGIIPIQANASYPDITSPEIISYIVNMTSQIITLTFSESIDITSLNIQKLSLQNQAAISAFTATITLDSTIATLLPYNNLGRILELQLTSLGFIKIKNFETLAISKDTTYIAADPLFLTDRALNKNQLKQIFTGNAFRVTTYIPDYIRPILLSWSMDMSNDILNLTFSEPIDTNTLKISEIIIKSDKITVDSTISVKLTTSIFYNKGYGIVIIFLSRIDLSAIKKKKPLCTLKEYCYISFNENFVSDIKTQSDINIVQNKIIPSTGLQVDIHTPDTKSPELISFGIDVNIGQLFLSFNEPVNTLSLNSAGIILYADSTQIKYYRLSSNSFADTIDDSDIIITLSHKDFINLKSVGSVAIQITTTYMALAYGTIKDIAGNNILESIKSPFYLQASSYFNDVTVPSLYAVYYDITTLQLHLLWTDTIIMNKVPLALSNIFLANSDSRVTALTTSNLLTLNDGADIILGLNNLDISIKNIDDQNEKNIYINKFNAVTDPALNPNSIMTVIDAIREGNMVLSFRLDLTFQYIELELIYPLNSNNYIIHMNNFILHDNDNEIKVTLSNETNRILSNDGYFIRLYLNIYDYFNILQELRIDTKDFVLLSVQNNAIYDNLGKNLGRSKDVKCIGFRPDINVPIITHYILNLGNGTLSIQFSKPMDMRYININSIKILSNNNITKAKIVQLSQTSIIPRSDGLLYDTVIHLNLNSGIFPTDKDLIYLTKSIALTSSSTYITISNGFMTDTAVPANYLLPITTPLSAQNIFFDNDPPIIIRFDLDLTNLIIKLTFNEGINRTTNLPYKYMLLANPSIETSAQYILTNTTITDLSEGIAGTIIKMKISKYDIDNIMLKAPLLLTSISNTYIATIDYDAIKDISDNANGMSKILFRFAIPVSTFITDNNPPNIIKFDANVNIGLIDLYFDKVVDCTKTKTNLIVLQFAEFIGTSTEFMLFSNTSTTVICLLQYSLSVQLKIGLSDMVLLRSYLVLFKLSSSTYIRPLRLSFFDVFDNSILEVPDGRAINVNFYTADAIPPKLISFTVTSQKALILTFNEPIKLSTLLLTNIKFQNKKTSPTFSQSLTSATTFVKAENNNRVITLALNGDYTSIVAVSTVFSDQESTFLTISSTLVQDTSLNPVVAILSSFALALGPTIISYELNMNLGYLILTFSEVVNSTFTPIGITIQNNSIVSTTNVPLITTTKFILTSSTNYYVILNITDINTIKYQRIAQSLKTTYLSVLYGLTNSLSLSTLIPLLKTVTIEPYAAIMSDVYTSDTTPPLCIDFGLNLNYGYLYLKFNEPVEVSSTIISYITLVVSSTGKSVRLSTSPYIELIYLTILKINITSNDLNNIKLANTNGAVNKMLLLPNVVKDYANNSIVGNTQLNQVSRSFFIPDTTPPKITNIAVDLTRKIIEIIFDEVIEINSIRPENIYFYSSSSISTTPSEFIQLSNYTIIELDSTTGAVLLDLDTYKNDGYALTVHDTIAINLATTYMVLLNVEDVAHNEQLQASSAIHVSSYQSDTSIPKLLSFYLVYIINVYRLSFYFSKPMDVVSFNCSDFILLSNFSILDSNLISLRLKYIECTMITTDNYSRNIIIQLSPAVFDSKTTIYSDPNTIVHTFINTIDEPVSIDKTGLLLEPLIDMTVLSNERKTKYSEGPQILSYVINMNTGDVTIVFSEPISRNVFKAEKLGFYSTVTGLTIYLTNSSIMYPFETDSPIFNDIGIIKLSNIDFIKLKSIDVPLIDNIYLIVNFNMTINTYGFSVVPITINNKLKPKRFRVDSIPPILLNTTLNMGAETIELEFDEPIRVSTIKLTNIYIQNSLILDLSNSRKLTGGSAKILDTRLTIQLSKIDSAAIKLNKALGKNISTSFISFDFGTMFDMSNNALIPISSTSALNFNKFIADKVSPNLEYYDLNMDTGLLKLQFSEPVQILKMKTNLIILQGRYNSANTELYQLEETTILSPDASLIQLQLSENDIHNIKLVRNLCRDRSTTFIVYSSSFVVDMNNNNVTSIENGAALPALYFTADIHSPYIINYEFIYDTFELKLIFNELVQTISVIPIALTLQDGPTAATSLNFYTLTSSTKVVFISTIPFSTEIILKISLSDMNYIKYLFPLATNINKTYISILTNFVLDTYGNSLVPILINNAKQVINLERDTVTPLIVRYELDFFLGVIRFEFTETVNIQSFIDSEITIQTTSVGRFGKILSLKDSIITQELFSDAYKVTIILSTLTFNALKFNHIANTKYSSYLVYSDKMISDYMENYLPPLWDGSVQGFYPRIPDSYITDTVLPSLKRWYIDSENFNIHMLFDEPIIITNVTNFLFSTNFKSLLGQQSITDSLINEDISLNNIRLQLSPDEIILGNVTYFHINPKHIIYNDYNTEAVFDINDICLKYKSIIQLDGNTKLECIQYISFQRFIELLYIVKLSNGYTIGLSYDSIAAKDFANVPNVLESRSLAFSMLMSDRDCSPCPMGYYTSTRCTLTKDRICSKCSTCNNGYFSKVECQQFDNTICQKCKPCPLGTYVSKQCTSTTETQCSTCTVCNNFEYEARQCIRGLDTICNTCGKCSLAASDKSICEYKGLYITWRLANCCTDSNGNKILCKEVARENMKITAKKSLMKAFSVKQDFAVNVISSG